MRSRAALAPLPHCRPPPGAALCAAASRVPAARSSAAAYGRTGRPAVDWGSVPLLPLHGGLLLRPQLLPAIKSEQFRVCNCNCTTGATQQLAAAPPAPAIDGNPFKKELKQRRR